MTIRCNLIFIILFLFLIPLTAVADIIVFKSGKPLEVEHAWEKDKKVFFYLGGLEASVSKKDVLRIERKKIDRGELSTDLNKSEKRPAKISDVPPKKEAKLAEVDKPLKKALPPKPSEKSLNQSKRAGFRDMRWGVELKTVKDLVELNTNTGLEEVKEYKRKNDELTMGDANLKSIVYAFWRDQFFTVTIRTEGKADYIALRGEAFKRFGKGQPSKQTHERYLWSDASTDRMLKYIQEEQAGLLWMRSKKIDRQYKLARLNVPSTYLRWIKAKN